MHTKSGVHTRGDLHSVGIWKLARPGSPQNPLCGRDVPTAQGRRRMGARDGVQICTPLHIVRTAPELQRRCLESAYSLVGIDLRITDLGPCSIEKRRSRPACTAPLKRSGLAALTETTCESTVGTLTSYDALDTTMRSHLSCNTSFRPCR